MKNEEQYPRRDPYIFETRDVIWLTGIPATYLNKFIEHRSFGITPSIREGTGRGSRRLFSDEDVLGIALVWTLFQAGLRSKAIGEVLRGARTLETPEGLATDAAVAILQNCDSPDEDPHVLVIRRWLGRSRRKGGKLRVSLETNDYAAPRLDLASELVIPVDMIFDEVNRKIQRFSSKRRS
jgi:DNA-binding transcriptional MerR regulator